MPVSFRLSPEQRATIGQIALPAPLALAVQQPVLCLDDQAAGALGDLLTDRLAYCGFDRDYNPTSEGRCLEELIDALFVR